jgi:hypothetical protein
MAGVPMGVIAAQLGHADTRMTEKQVRPFGAELCRADHPGQFSGFEYIGGIENRSVAKPGGKLAFFHHWADALLEGEKGFFRRDSGD